MKSVVKFWVFVIYDCLEIVIENLFEILGEKKNNNKKVIKYLIIIK